MKFDDFNIARDKEKNRQLFKQGYCTIKLLDREKVAHLQDIFHAHHQNESIEGLFVSSNMKSWDELIAISNKISAVVNDAIDEHFNAVDKIGGTFIVKNQDPTNLLHPHQDWSIVDEEKHRSFTIWIALQAVNESNGALYVLPTSQDWVRGYRHISIPSVYGRIYNLTWSYMKPIYLEAGEAIVFDHSLVHASQANTSGQLRIAATTTILTQGASMRISCNNNGQVEEYACPSGFYIRPEAQKGPFDLPKIKDVAFEMVQLNEEQFISFARKHKFTPAKREASLFNKLKSLFKK
jgi:hypothetical protein